MTGYHFLKNSEFWQVQWRFAEKPVWAINQIRIFQLDNFEVSYKAGSHEHGSNIENLRLPTRTQSTMYMQAELILILSNNLSTEGMPSWSSIIWNENGGKDIWNAVVCCT